MNEADKRVAKNLFLTAGVVTLLMLILPLMIGLGAGGFDSAAIIQLYTFYSSFAVAGIIIILCFGVYELFIPQGDERYGRGVLFSDPGELPAAGWAKIFKGRPFILILSSIIFFSLLALLVGLKGQQSFTGEAVVGQQFTAVGEVIFRLFLIPLAENVSLLSPIVLFLIILRHLARKGSWTSLRFKITLWVVGTVLSGLLGLINHKLRYAGSDASLISVFFFWSLGGFFTLVIGSYIPFVVMHSENNLIVDIAKSFSSDQVPITMFILLAITLILLIWRIVRLRKSKT